MNLKVEEIYFKRYANLFETQHKLRFPNNQAISITFRPEWMKPYIINQLIHMFFHIGHLHLNKPFDPISASLQSQKAPKVISTHI